MFDTNRQPLAAYASQVPHSQSGYDENVHGLAATYFNVNTVSTISGNSSKQLFGAPKLHGTGIGPSNGDMCQTWGSTQPFTPDLDPNYGPSGRYGWGMHLTGYIQLAATGTYTFQIDSDDGAKLFIDNNNLINDWADGSFRTHPTHTFINDTANSWHKITLDYYNKAVNGVDDTDGELRLWLTLPSGAQTCNIGSILTPSYGLPTSNKVFDSQVGDTSTTTSYGPKPDLGLVQSASADPTGLNLTSSSSYEAQGATGSFNRQTSKTLPGGGGSYAAPNTSTLIDEGLDPAWGDWSWDSTNSFNDTTNPDSGTQDTAWTINAAWAGLDIHNMSGIDTTPYNSVTFAMKGTNPQVGLNLMDTNDVALASQVTDLSQYGSLPDSHGYVTYTVPLSLLGGANKTVYGFMLQDITGAAQPTIYLDSVKFTNAPSSYTIMNEDLANGWGDWSWSSTNNFTDTTKPFVGTKDTSWAVTAAFGAIDVHNNNGSVNAAPYKTLSFELPVCRSRWCRG